jgi:hypothetical protein
MQNKTKITIIKPEQEQQILRTTQKRCNSIPYKTTDHSTHLTTPHHNTSHILQGRVIAESNDIMQVLEEEYPTHNPLLPKKSDPQSPRVAPLLKLEVRNSELRSATSAVFDLSLCLYLHLLCCFFSPPLTSSSSRSSPPNCSFTSPPLTSS